MSNTEYFRIVSVYLHVYAYLSKVTKTLNTLNTVTFKNRQKVKIKSVLKVLFPDLPKPLVDLLAAAHSTAEAEAT